MESDVRPHDERGRRLQRPSMPFWLARTTFDEHGTPLSRRNLTAPQDGMGYISISDGAHALFATERKQPQGWSNVDTFLVRLDGSATPRPLFHDIEPLLQPCRRDPLPCTQVSTFHAIFTPDGKHVVFAYRAWSSLGDAAGSQALAISDVSGGQLRVLTSSRDVFTQDMCPTLLPARPELVVFMRSRHGGMRTSMAMLNITSSKLTTYDEWPAVGDNSGCPAPSGSDGFMFLGCAQRPCSVAAGDEHHIMVARRWGTTGMQPVADPHEHSGWAQLRVALDESGRAAWPTSMFPVGLTAAPGYVGVFETSQCDRVWGDALPEGNNSIVCEGADPQHLFFLKLFINPANGAPARNDTTTLRHVMTPRPFALRHTLAARG